MNMNKETLRMQMLAGILTESQYKKLTINEEFNSFLDTEEGGYMREYIDETAEEEELDLEYRDEFDIAFDLALAKLKNDEPELNSDAIIANKEAFFQ